MWVYLVTNCKCDISQHCYFFGTPCGISSGNSKPFKYDQCVGVMHFTINSMKCDLNAIFPIIINYFSFLTAFWKIISFLLLKIVKSLNKLYAMWLNLKKKLKHSAIFVWQTVKVSAPKRLWRRKSDDVSIWISQIRAIYLIKNFHTYVQSNVKSM